MGQVWKLTDWNDIIQQVNDLAQNPDAGCDPIDPLEEVEAPHRWSKTDIQEVQDKLKEICEDNTFADTPDLWKQSIIDEINDAIDLGWCDCLCQAEDETYIIFSYGSHACPEVREWGCYQDNPCIPPAGSYCDWFTPAAAATGFGPGIGGGYQVVLQTYLDDEPPAISFLYSNTFDCAGNQTQPMSEPWRDDDGHLAGSAYADMIICRPCSLYKVSCFLWFCSCSKCAPGVCSCCTPPIYSLDPTCRCVADDNFIQACYGGDWSCHDYLSVWSIRKYCDESFHGEGEPCRTCCSDGIGFCDNLACIGDPACD